MVCEVFVEKILDVGEQRSIGKSFFEMEGVKKACIAIAIMALFFILPNFYKMKIPTVNTKNSTWAWSTKIFHQKKLKSLKDMLKWCNFIRYLEGQPREGVVHGSPNQNPRPPNPIKTLAPSFHPKPPDLGSIMGKPYPPSNLWGPVGGPPKLRAGQGTGDCRLGSRPPTGGRPLVPRLPSRGAQDFILPFLFQGQPCPIFG